MINDQHILLVEDDETLQELIEKLLKDNSYIVSKAKNIAEAEKYINLFIFDLIILDVMLPDSTGLDFYRDRVKNRINTPVIFLSALSDVDMFAITKNKTGGCDIVIGYSSTNTNRVNIPVDCDKCNLENPINFNANLFKEVLVANRECKSAVLEVSNEGLARVNFKVDDYDSTYYIVAMQDVD